MSRSLHAIRSLKLGVAALSIFSGSCGARPQGDTADSTTLATSEAIVHGAADRGRHPAVLALYMSDGATSSLCSGALVAADVVLTARHCVSYLEDEGVSCPPSRPQVGRNREPSSIFVLASEEVEGGRLLARGQAIVTPSSDALCDHDIALLRLDRPIKNIAPIPIGRRRAPMAGGRIIAVGFGEIGHGAGAGARRFRIDVPILGVTRSEFVVGESTCSGDSGGPALDAESGDILGVVSRGNVRCVGLSAHNIYTRVTPFLDLIDRMVPVHAPIDEQTPNPVTDMGDECSSGSTCSSGICLLAKPHGYCSRACGPDVGRCPPGFGCVRKDATSSVCQKH